MALHINVLSHHLLWRAELRASAQTILRDKLENFGTFLDSHENFFLRPDHTHTLIILFMIV